MSQQAIQVSVAPLTGFPGAGKTTLLNPILSNQQGLRSAVLVNGFGEVGCICCSINHELQEAMQLMPEPIDLTVVSSTGLTDPWPVALTFLARDLRERLRLDSIITLIDAEHLSPTALYSTIAGSRMVSGGIRRRVSHPRHCRRSSAAQDPWGTSLSMRGRKLRNS